MEFNENEIRAALAKSWSSETAIQWQADNPALGQCNVTALLVDELFGGRILKTKLEEGFHFYNETRGRRYDFTDSQFEFRIEYDDLESNREEAEKGATHEEIKSLRNAFSNHYKRIHSSS